MSQGTQRLRVEEPGMALSPPEFESLITNLLSYEFAEGKPLELLSGSHLLHLLG
jgi:hypothetical protein